MKLHSFPLYFFILQSQAESQISLCSPQTVRLNMGFYLLSFDIVSSRADIQIVLNYWIDELTRLINSKNNSTILYDNIKQMNSDFVQGKLDMIIAPPLLLAINFDRNLLSDGYMGVNGNNKTDQLVIIARRGVVSSLDDFEDKRLLLLKDDLLVKLFLETEVIKQFGLSYQKLFSSVSYEKKNHRAILALFFDKADVAVVYQSALDVMIKLNPQIANTINVLKKIPVKSTNYAYFHRDYNFQEALREAAKRFNSEPRGRQVLEMFNTAEIAICKVNELEILDDFYRVYLKLKNKLDNDSERLKNDDFH